MTQYSYLVVYLPRDVSRDAARKILTDHAEYGDWELTRVLSSRTAAGRLPCAVGSYARFARCELAARRGTRILCGLTVARISCFQCGRAVHGVLCWARAAAGVSDHFPERLPHDASTRTAGAAPEGGRSRERCSASVAMFRVGSVQWLDPVDRALPAPGRAPGTGKAVS